MQNRFVEVTTRRFDPASVSGLSNKARAAAKEAFEAMSTWRHEMADSSEEVVKKMAAAAAALGWPEQIVNATRAQMHNIAEMQVQTMDRMMDAWEERLKLPNPMVVSPSEMLSKTLPHGGSAASWPGANAFEVWMQLAEQGQKFWADAMAAWTKETRHLTSRVHRE